MSEITLPRSATTEVPINPNPEAPPITVYFEGSVRNHIKAWFINLFFAPIIRAELKKNNEA